MVLIVVLLRPYKYLNILNYLVFWMFSWEYIVSRFISFWNLNSFVLIGSMVMWLSVVIGVVWIKILSVMYVYLFLDVLFGIIIALVARALTPCVISIPRKWKIIWALNKLRLIFVSTTITSTVDTSLEIVILLIISTSFILSDFLFDGCLRCCFYSLSHYNFLFNL